MSQPINTFICYAHEDHEVVEGLKKQLAIFEKKGYLQLWSDGKILAGEQWDKSIKRQLEQAELILLFISVDFINSEYIEKTELQAALQRHRDGQATLLPIIVRPCHWEEYFDIGQFQALPTKARPILSSHFTHRDQAFFEIAAGIKKTAQDLREQKLAAALAQEKEATTASRQATAAKLQRNKDGAAWKVALELDTLEGYESYLEKGYTLHETEAEQRINEIEMAEAKRRAEIKAQEKRKKELERISTFEELGRKVEEIREEKNRAVKNQQYEEAANLRDQESRLLRQVNYHLEKVKNEVPDWDWPPLVEYKRWIELEKERNGEGFIDIGLRDGYLNEEEYDDI